MDVRTAGLGEEVRDVPVDGGLPESIVEAVEDVEKHRANIARGRPISWDKVRVQLGVDGVASVRLLVSVAASPDDHGQDKERSPSNLGSDSTTDLVDIKSITQYDRGDDLCQVVQKAVERLGTGRKSGTIDGVLLVGIEPVRGPEHGEEQDDERLESDGFPESDELRLPARILHHNHTAAINTDDI